MADDVPSEQRRSGATVAREALEQARKAAAGARREADRSQAARRRAEIRAANLTRSAEQATPGPSNDPVAFGASIDDLLTDRGWQNDLKVARVTADWPTMVGPDIAGHCEPIALRDGVLTIEAESTAWATQIRLLSRQVIGRIADVVGPGVVGKLVVRGPAGPSWRHGRLRVPGPGPRDTYG